MARGGLSRPAAKLFLNLIPLCDIVNHFLAHDHWGRFVSLFIYGYILMKKTLKKKIVRSLPFASVDPLEGPPETLSDSASFSSVLDNNRTACEASEGATRKTVSE